jgi:hypothetical protein
LTVWKHCATYKGIDPKHVAQRIKLTEMLSWKSLFILAVEHVLKHEVTYGSEPAGEKCEEHETAAEQTATSSLRM